jgi:hypothetical protein
MIEKATPGASGTRAQRRARSKRKLRREARRDVTRVIELDRAGHSPSSIAASVGLGEDLVREILERAEAVRQGEIAG